MKGSSMEFVQPAAMRQREFEQVRQMVYDFCGIDLTGKQVLVDARLRKKIQDGGFPTVEAFLDHVQRNPKSEAFADMIDVLTTNHTSFFRESQHFDLLRNTIVPAFAGSDRLKLWSAACSTGEEPYTITFSLLEAMGDAVFSRVEILATDISTRVLEKAQKGLYPVSSVSQLPVDLRRQCLLKGTGRYADQCLVKRELRSLITFRQFNLLDDCSTFGPFHVIFCRNVMIYFDQQTQERLVNRLAMRLLPGGYLLIGHSESLSGLNQPLQYIAPATYRKAGSMGMAAQSESTLRRSR